jgi:hypothetical protein
MSVKKERKDRKERNSRKKAQKAQKKIRRRQSDGWMLICCLRFFVRRGDRDVRPWFSPIRVGRIESRISSLGIKTPYSDEQDLVPTECTHA